MARAIKQGQHIFIAFQDGEAVLDSQLRPRMYKSREQFEKSFPAWRDGKAELVEYAPTLTPPNEPLTEDQLEKMVGSPIWIESARRAEWMLLWGCHDPGVYGRSFIFTRRTAQKEQFQFSELGVTWWPYHFPPDRRPPEGEEDA